MTQVVPTMDSNLPIVKKAKSALGADFNYTSFESFLLGEMFLQIVSSIEGNITKEKFFAQAKKTKFNMQGFYVDLTDDNHASDLVSHTILNGSEYTTMVAADWESLWISE